MVIALDSNILIDLRSHGRAILDDEPLPKAVASHHQYAADLYGLSTIINLWMLRDIRLIVTPRARTDAKRLTKRFAQGVAASIDALATCLAFQFGDWTAGVPSDLPPPPPLGSETGLPAGADKDLVLEAQAAGAHIFLTRDHRVLTNTRLTGPPLNVLSPSTLAADLLEVRVNHLFGGVCGQADCPYRGHAFPAPDIGKWGPLFNLLA